MNPTPKTKRKILWPIWAVLGLIAASAIVYAIMQSQPSAKVTVNGQSYQTSVVSRGNIELSATGYGSLLPSQTVNLSFTTSGTVGQLSVKTGDRVTKGEVLAVLSEVDELELVVQNAQQAVDTAQKNLDDLLGSGAQAIAQAYADYAAAEKAYATAQDDLLQKGDPRCKKDLTDSYQAQYFSLKKQASRWQAYLEDPNTQYGHDYILQNLTPLEKQRDQAYENWKYCEGYTDLEINQSQANQQVAKANLDLTKSIYDSVVANQGVDPDEFAIDQAALKSAQLQLTLAQDNLKGATLTSPIDGIVTKVAANQGEDVESGIFITLTDLTNPELQVNVDETDVNSFKVGCSAQITFTAYDAKTYTGEVTQVLPTLLTMFNTSSVQGTVTLKDATMLNGNSLLSGLNGNVTISCSKATNVLVVPLAALHEDTTGTYVNVYNAQGQLEKRLVEVGQKDATNVEIRSGLNQGEAVVTTTAKASGSASN